MDKIKKRLELVRNDKDYRKIYKDKLKVFWVAVTNLISKIFKIIFRFVSKIFSKNIVCNQKCWIFLCFGLLIIAVISLIMNFIKDDKWIVKKLNETIHIKIGMGTKNNDKLIEKAYMWGQIDALNNKVRIKKNGSYWVYKMTPWKNKSIIPDTKMEIKQTKNEYPYR